MFINYTYNQIQGLPLTINGSKYKPIINHANPYPVQEAVKEEKKVVNTNSTKLNSTPKTLPNTGESTNNFLSAIGLSFLALIGLLKRKNNN